MNRSIMSYAVCALSVSCLAGAAWAGPDFNPPAYRGLPNSTTQGWDFINGFASPPQPANSRVVPLRNPNLLFDSHVPGIPNFSPPSIFAVTRQVTSQPNIGDDFMTLLGIETEDNPARLLLAIPNFQSDSACRMRIQLTYRVAGLPQIDLLHFYGSTLSNEIPTYFDGLTDRVDPERGNWHQATLDLEFSRTAQWHTVIFTNNSGLPLDIESIVIDTVVVPAPGATVIIGCAGLMALRRRR